MAVIVAIGKSSDPNAFLNWPLTIQQQLRALRKDPQVAIGTHYKAAYWTYGGLAWNRLLNQGESLSIEANQPTIRAQPQISIIGLADCVYDSTDKAAFFAPFTVHVLRDGFGRIERMSLLKNAR